VFCLFTLLTYCQRGDALTYGIGLAYSMNRPIDIYALLSIKVISQITSQSAHQYSHGARYQCERNCTYINYYGAYNTELHFVTFQLIQLMNV